MSKRTFFDDKTNQFSNFNEGDTQWDKAYSGQPDPELIKKIAERHTETSKTLPVIRRNKSLVTPSPTDCSDWEEVEVKPTPVTTETYTSNTLPLSTLTRVGNELLIQTPKATVEKESVDKPADTEPYVTVETEISDRALRIAEDFVSNNHLLIVGEALYIYRDGFYQPLSGDSLKRELLKKYREEIGKSNANSVLNGAAQLLRLCTQKVLEEFPDNPNIIVFKNGTLDLKENRFVKHSPKFLANSSLAIDFRLHEKYMPNTKQFLETIANGDYELYELMLQVIGYILSNDLRAKSFFYLEGVGDAGKSKFCDLIASFFPKEGNNKVARVALQDLGGKFSLGNLANTRLNISEDLPDAPLSPTTVSRIKMISDSNRLEAEAKYVQAYSFKPVCKMLFASNHPLRLKEYDEAFVNRVVYIPFMHPIPKHKQDRDILSKMQGELPALFNHALKAYLRLVESNYAWAGADRFKPEILISAPRTSVDNYAILREFVETCCVLDQSSVTSSNDLKIAYEYFCQARRYLPIKGDRFSRELNAVLPDTVERTKIGNQKRGFRGIRLTDTSPI